MNREEFYEWLETCPVPCDVITDDGSNIRVLFWGIEEDEND